MSCTIKSNAWRKSNILDQLINFYQSDLLSWWKTYQTILANFNYNLDAIYLVYRLHKLPFRYFTCQANLSWLSTFSLSTLTVLKNFSIFSKVV